MVCSLSRRALTKLELLEARTFNELVNGAQLLAVHFSAIKTIEAIIPIT